MLLKKSLLFILLLRSVCYNAAAQCSTLRPQIDYTFNTDRVCAPVMVTQFKVTYYFNVPQDPNTISLRYEWNDPTNSVDIIDINNGLIAGAGNTSFTINSISHLYTDNNLGCSIMPTVYIQINGVVCPTSRKTQTAYFWGNDDQANGVLAINPQNWDVCFNKAINNARFRDNSEFNCNPIVEPDVPNQLPRHVQFVYGTANNAATSIRNLSLNDGAIKNLTDGSGNLATTETRGLGLPVTGAYFGPIDEIPFPASAPNSVTFPMNAAASTLNAVGNQFEVTMYNWNVCNPWNGDNANPNYEDAIATRGYIRIVDAPAPAFFTRDANNVQTADFCIDELVRMKNTTPNINNYSYTWRFYDDEFGTTLLGTRTSFDPDFVWATGGRKLIRLTALNPATQTACTEEITHIVNITPALSAHILVTDLLNNTITPDFCQEATPPLNNFNVRFTDVSVGTVTANTRWRWEFYDQNNALVFESPGAGTYSSTALGPFDRIFTTPGVYRARLMIKDNITACESRDDITIRVFEKPSPAFTFDRICIGNATHFKDASTVNAIVPGEQIVLREWDMNYDGTFDKDPALDNEIEFDHTFAASGNHQVALRVTTNTGSCSDFIEQTIVVDPLPNASITSNISSGCSELSVDFTNNSIAGQPDVIKEYHWEIDAGSGYQVDSVQKPSDPGFGPLYTHKFSNITASNKIFNVRLRVITVNGCEQVSTPLAITVNPGPTSGFVSLNYSPFNNNCSPVSVNFLVDNQTQSMNPTDYQWTISDVNGIIDQISSGTNPNFTYPFVNSTQLIKDFSISLRAELQTGCYGDSTRTIRVSPIPSSEFTITAPVNTCAMTSLHLDATQKGLVEYAWTILINNVLVYTSTTDGDDLDYDINRIVGVTQSVEIRLITTNVANCQSTQTAKLYSIPAANNLTASFTATPLSQQLPNATVTLTNTSTPGAFQYLWDFGDGTNSTNGSEPGHTYTTYGSYTITLTVSDNSCSANQSITVKIDPVPPMLDFSYDPASGCSPLTVDFTNLSQFTDPSTYFWEFGAGQGTSHAIDPSYTYFEPGLYSVTLTAAGPTGDVASITKSLIIEVFPSPNAQFSVYPDKISLPGDLYTNNRSVGAVKFLWDFGDNTTSEEFEPRHTYTSEGVFAVELVAYGANGCTDTARVASPVKTEFTGQVLIPNALTPSLSGPGSTDKMNNEVFIPLMSRVSEFHMFIFNRWGTVLFESTDQNVGWDGYYQGKLCAQDVYIYKIVLEYDDGKKITRTGDITLIR